MKKNRRSFIKGSAIALSGSLLVPIACQSSSKPGNNKTAAGKLTLSFEPYELQLKHTFTLASSSRTTTPVMLTKLEYDGYTGYGEASMPPYLGESHETAQRFLSKVDLSGFSDPFLTEDILAYIDSIAPGNCAAKASVDIALHDLIGNILEIPLYKLWGLNPDHTPNTSFTIAIDTPEVVRQKVLEAADFRILKVKLGGGNDREMINAVREITDVPLCVDVNQGWTDKHTALDLIHWLKEQGVVFIEQPMPVEDLDEIAWLTEKSPLPVIADEAVQRLKDMIGLKGIYSGVNIKQMKCTGLREAWKMINFARAYGMTVMLGCMTETSCGVSAAAQLSPMVDFADLDGNLLISNDVFEGVKVIDGKLTLPDRPGIGVIKTGDIL
ncbi:MAG: muconate cycloisomerase [Bacteroides sp. SM23_62_1]|nr:MAG: muconate cycloisomerase [Bacteroides sp. SM23_62_1]